MRQGSHEQPAALGQPRPVAEMRALLAARHLTGANSNVFLADDECLHVDNDADAPAPANNADAPAPTYDAGAAGASAEDVSAQAGAAAQATVDSTEGADAEDEDEVAAQARAALGLPWPEEYEEQLRLHARALLGVVDEAEASDGAAGHAGSSSAQGRKPARRRKPGVKASLISPEAGTQRSRGSGKGIGGRATSSSGTARACGGGAAKRCGPLRKSTRAAASKAETREAGVAPPAGADASAGQIDAVPLHVGADNVLQGQHAANDSDTADE